MKTYDGCIERRAHTERGQPGRSRRAALRCLATLAFAASTQWSLHSSRAYAQTSVESTDSALTVAALALEVDDLKIARSVANFGDQAVLDALSDATSLAKLGGIRGSRWLHAPEDALEQLAELANSRDALLAPEALIVCAAIIEALTPAQLVAHETDLSELQRTELLLRKLAEDPDVLTELRITAAEARLELIDRLQTLDSEL
ncbi:MAG: hypothetical protein AAF550_06075 [Myxococcota bacterium]